MTEKTHLCTKHEWGEALAVHRPAVLRTQGLEDGNPFQGRLGRWTRKNVGLWRAVAPVIYAPDDRLSGSHSGVSAEYFSVDGQRQSVTKMIERYDQSSPSATALGDRRLGGFWERSEWKAVQGCFLSQRFSAIMKLSAGWPR